MDIAEQVNASLIDYSVADVDGCDELLGGRLQYDVRSGRPVMSATLNRSVVDSRS